VTVIRFLHDASGSRHGTIAMVEPVRARLAVLPRESEWVFTTIRGNHYTPSTRAHHWNRVRCSVGLGTTALYEATRHYFAWYLLNVLELPDHVVAAQLRHTDGGTLVRELYGASGRGDRARAHPRGVPRHRARRGASHHHHRQAGHRMTDPAGVLLVHDREMHLCSADSLVVGDTLEVVRGNGPREGDRMGIATVAAFEDGAPVLEVRFDDRPG
jgi:hypothetical protein